MTNKTLRDAAPDMLEALVALDGVMHFDTPMMGECMVYTDVDRTNAAMAKALAAIREAKGEQVGA